MFSGSGLLAPQLQCFYALSLVISLLTAAAKGNSDSNQIKAAIRMFLEAHAAAYPASTTIPKIHFLIHIPRIVERLSWAPNTMVLERKHKGFKRYATAMDNTSKCFDKTVLTECTVKSLYDLDEASHLDLAPGLIGAMKPSKIVADFIANELKADLAAAAYSKTTRISEVERVSAGDVVSLRLDGQVCVGRVWFFLKFVLAPVLKVAGQFVLDLCRCSNLFRSMLTIASGWTMIMLMCLGSNVSGKRLCTHWTAMGVSRCCTL